MGNKKVPNTLIPYWLENDKNKNELVEYLKQQHEEIVTEIFAEVAHEIWAHWIKYMLSRCEDDDLGMIIQWDDVKRWQRQMATKYLDLSETEKDSDREIASLYIIPKINEIIP